MIYIFLGLQERCKSKLFRFFSYSIWFVELIISVSVTSRSSGCIFKVPLKWESHYWSSFVYLTSFGSESPFLSDSPSICPYSREFFEFSLFYLCYSSLACLLFYILFGWIVYEYESRIIYKSYFIVILFFFVFKNELFCT